MSTAAVSDAPAMPWEVFEVQPKGTVIRYADGFRAAASREQLEIIAYVDHLRSRLAALEAEAAKGGKKR